MTDTLKFKPEWFEILNRRSAEVRDAVIAAVTVYFYTGTEPTITNEAAAIAFDFIRHEIDAARARRNKRLEKPMEVASSRSPQRPATPNESMEVASSRSPQRPATPNEKMEVASSRSPQRPATPNGGTLVRSVLRAKAGSPAPRTHRTCVHTSLTFNPLLRTKRKWHPKSRSLKHRKGIRLARILSRRPFGTPKLRWAL